MKSNDLSFIKDCLTEVGVKLSDVFGCDHVLWVEGPTEEIAFSLLQQNSMIKTEDLINIVAVKNTGDFYNKKKKHVQLILDLYKKISTSNALIPPAVSIIFDKEKLTDSDVSDVERESQGLIKFIPRRMFENYLLHPKAITSIINNLQSFKNIPIKVNTINNWLKINGQSFSTSKSNIKSNKWLLDVDGANLLKTLFAQLSGNKEVFVKTTHSVLLTEYLIRNDPKHLKELTEFINNCLVKRDNHVQS